jgi:ankyrin repeat protein
LSRAVEKGDERVMKLLLDNGARSDFEDENGQTSLSRAVEGGSVVVLQLLLTQDVKLDFKYHIVSEHQQYIVNESLLN